MTREKPVDLSRGVEIPLFPLTAVPDMTRAKALEILLDMQASANTTGSHDEADALRIACQDVAFFIQAGHGPSDPRD
jgi:hypothetical protein